MRTQRTLAVLLFLWALALYTYTLAPSVMWGDAVEAQVQVALGGSSYMYFVDLENAIEASIDHFPFARLGVAAWDHPLYIMLGQIFAHLVPWGDVAYRMNLMSALTAAVVVVVVYLVGQALVQDDWAAIMGALALAVSHTFWLHAVMAEIYALHLLFMISLIGLTFRWVERRRGFELRLLMLLAGLGMANYLLLALTLVPLLAYLVLATTSGATFPARVTWLWRAIRSRTGGICFGLFLIGFAPWWIQFLRMARMLGVPLTLRLAAGAPWLPQSLAISMPRDVIAHLLGYFGWLLYQFTPLGLALAAYGWVCLRHTQSGRAWLLLALWVVHTAFSANYHVKDQFAFHLPSYLIVALMMTTGAAALLRRLDIGATSSRRSTTVRVSLLVALIILPVGLYTTTPRLLRAADVTDITAGIAPIGVGVRNTLAIFLDPNQRDDDSAARFGRSTLAQLAPRALVFTPSQSDGETYLILRYFQLVEQRRPDVRLELMLFYPRQSFQSALLEIIRAESGCRPLYLASVNPRGYPLDELATDFAIVPEANIYRVQSRRGAMARPCNEQRESKRSGTLADLLAEVVRNQ